jgi:phytoene synthase
MARVSDNLLACERAIRDGSKSFYFASMLLPREVRLPACALYSFCRTADDAVDEGREADRVARLVTRLDGIFGAGALASPYDRALREVIHEHDLPRAPLDALLEGFAWDAEGRTYETIDDLEGYCVRVASTVGLLMTLIMGRRDDDTLARACDLGVAMQLTNICRDVGDDARRARVYLPLAWLREMGVDPAELVRAPVHSAALGGVVTRVLDEAARLYRLSDMGISRLPRSCRWSIATASRVYEAIGDEVRRRGGDGVTSRAIVPTKEKIRIAGTALGSLVVPTGVRPLPAQAAARPLIEAVR